MVMGWVKCKKVNIKLVKNVKIKLLYEFIVWVEIWLCNNIYSNFVMKWDMECWGEIFVDFGWK